MNYWFSIALGAVSVVMFGCSVCSFLAYGHTHLEKYKTNDGERVMKVMSFMSGLLCLSLMMNGILLAMMVSQ